MRSKTTTRRGYLIHFIHAKKYVVECIQRFIVTGLTFCKLSETNNEYIYVYNDFSCNIELKRTFSDVL